MNRRGLIGHWKYHGAVATSGTAYDLSGNGNNGTLVGNAFIDNNGLNLDGSGDELRIAHNDQFNFGYSLWTIIILIQPTAPGEGNNSSVYGKQAHATQTTPIHLYQARSSYDIVLSLANVNYHDLLSATLIGTVTADEWTMITISRQSATNVVGYINTTKGLDETISDLPIKSNTDPVRLGSGNYSDCYFTGSINDVRIYNRALSAEEIKQIYHETKGRH